MRFIEAPVFTEIVDELLDDDEYRRLQLALLLRPEQGAIVPGGAGLRKVRWGAGARGKRGGVRVVYYWSGEEETIYMLFAYAKHEQEDLTFTQLKLLSRLVREGLQ